MPQLCQRSDPFSTENYFVNFSVENLRLCLAFNYFAWKSTQYKLPIGKYRELTKLMGTDHGATDKLNRLHRLPSSFETGIYRGLSWHEIYYRQKMTKLKKLNKQEVFTIMEWGLSICIWVVDICSQLKQQVNHFHVASVARPMNKSQTLMW